MAKNLRFGSATYTLVWHLFRRYVEEQELTTNEQEGIKIGDFYEWTQDQFGLFPHKEDLEEAYDLGEEDFERVNQLLSDPFQAMSKLYTWWPMLALSGRKPLTHKPVSIALSVAIQFEDGHQAQIPLPLGGQPEPYTDGMVLTLWRGQLAQISDVLAVRGIDSLYEQVCTGVEDTHELETEIPRNSGGLGF